MQLKALQSADLHNQFSDSRSARAFKALPTYRLQDNICAKYNCYYKKFNVITVTLHFIYSPRSANKDK